MLFRIILLSLATALGALAQAPTLTWQHNYGGALADSNLHAAQNNFNEIYLGGFGYSINQDFLSTTGISDIWLRQVDADGSTLWTQQFAGTQRDELVDITTTSDGGAVLLCYTASTDGTFTTSSPSLTGLWLMKVNRAGVISWKQYVGGNPTFGGAIITTSDGGLLVASSFSGTVNVPIGGSVNTLTSAGGKDVWILKFGSSGAPQWQRKLGGTADEIPASLLEFNNHYYFIGSTWSSSVNSQSSNGAEDVLAAKLTTAGTTIWTKLYGGLGNDYGTDLVVTGMGEIWGQAGSTSSNGDFASNAGGYDVWNFTVSETSGLIGNNFVATTATSSNDLPFDLDYLENESLILNLGLTEGTFTAADPSPANIFLSASFAIGGVSWVQAFGGSSEEVPSDLVILNDGGLLISGQSSSSNGNLTGNYGQSDFWAFKLFDCPTELTLNNVSIDETFSRSASSKITTNYLFEASVTRGLLSAPSVIMNPGFEIKSGVVFSATTTGCN